MTNDVAQAPTQWRELLFRAVGKSIAALFILLLFGPFAHVHRLESIAGEFGDTALSKRYAAQSRNLITVLMLDDASLRRLKTTWPVPRQIWAELLRTVGCARPKAIFFDVLFEPGTAQSATGAGDAALAAADARVGTTGFAAADCPVAGRADVSPVPVYYAFIGDSDRWAGFAGSDRKLAIEWDGSPLAYPLVTDHSGKPVNTAAFALAKVYCNASSTTQAAPPGCAHLPIGDETRSSIIPHWTSEIPAHQEDWVGSIDHCSGNAFSLRRLLFAGLLPFLPQESAPQDCPPFLTINVADFSADNFDRRLIEAIEGRVVLIGQSLSGAPDYAPAPMHRQLPGVYLHAMALENLLTMGSGFDRIDTETTLWFLVGLVLLFSGIDALLTAFAAANSLGADDSRAPAQPKYWLAAMTRHRAWWRLTFAIATCIVTAALLRLCLRWPPGMIPEMALMITVALFLGELSIEGHLYRLVFWIFRIGGKPH